MITKQYKGKALPRGIFYDNKKEKFGYRIKTKDTMGNPVDRTKCEFSTQTEAVKARGMYLYEIHNIKPEPEPEPVNVYDKTFSEVFETYLAAKAREKRPSTIVKQKSLWKNHLEPKFANRKLIDVTKGEMEQYLSDLYYIGDAYNKYEVSYAYGYVESFIKMFYLFYGYAYDNDWIPKDLYERIFQNKSTKLKMPDKTNEDKEEEGKPKIYVKEELDKIEKILKQTTAYLSYLMGIHLGLRISECMGIMWGDISWENQTISINKQMLYQDFNFCLVPPKTDNGKRTLYIPNVLFEYLKKYKEQQEKYKRERGKGYRNTEKVLVRLKNKEEELIGGEFIQRKPNGELITINSVKYWAKKIKEEVEINYKHHILRHTCASHIASQNVPKHSLMKFMGHGSIAVSEKYYVADNEIAEQKMRNALNTKVGEVNN